MSLLLQVAVIYILFLQQAFSTVSLSFGDWLRELSKMVTRATSRG